jgi:hypothetical protein
LTKGQKQFSGGWTVFSTKGVEPMGHPQAKREKK